MRMADETYYLNYIKKRASALATYGAEADDLAQEGLMALYEALLSFDSKRNIPFGVYASACINNRMVSAVRSAKAGKNDPLRDYSSIYDSDELLLSYADDPLDVLSGREGFRFLLNEIRLALSEKERKVLSLHLNGYSYADIASFLGIDRKAVDNALARARRKIHSVQ